MPEALNGVTKISVGRQRPETFTTKAGVSDLRAHSLTDSSVAYAGKEWNALRCALKRDGYLLIKGLLDEVLVSRVRRVPTSWVYGSQILPES